MDVFDLLLGKIDQHLEVWRIGCIAPRRGGSHEAPCRYRWTSPPMISLPGLGQATAHADPVERKMPSGHSKGAGGKDK
jgi:hypothetical protein